MARSKQTTRSRTRVEHDLLGDKAVPAEAYYGVQTARALENFNLSGVPVRQYPDLVVGLALVKQAAARANHECRALDRRRMTAIDKACREIVDGKLHDQFLVDLYQGGAGTSTNMNANEVIANRALELLGKRKGQYEHCSPNDHVNLSQSTNDAYPTALHLAIALLNTRLVEELRRLVAAFRRKGGQFRDVIKMGRTQLQDAVPMTLGQEFDAWAASLDNEVEVLVRVEPRLLEINMGGTAIGTGLNAAPGFPAACARQLSKLTGRRCRPAADLVEATQDTQPFVLYSSCLKSLAIKAGKICNDLRLLASGPRAGLREINLPALQPGSSIMPGKVNPVMPEVVNQVCFRVIGNDLTVTLAAEAGQLQLNVMEPVIILSILESQTLLKNAARSLRVYCVDGISANREICRGFVERSIGVVTALNPVLGYRISTELAAEAMLTGKGIVEIVRERKLLSEQQIDRLLDPARMAGAGGRRGSRAPRIRRGRRRP
ncbi:MAG TPA: aspartate ammonia-lyase [Planctomycetota bacterium]|nr:aspartate ammonia-lyase [Planctomycetota bacterium]